MNKVKFGKFNGMDEELQHGIKVDIQLDIDKLNRIYDLEQELGITLEVLFKALKERKIYIKSYFYLELEEEQIHQKIDYHYIENIEYCGNDDGCYEYCRDNWLFMFREDEYGNECVVRVKDYGKTWALTKEELE